jgi:hypothetical protein
VVIVDVAEDVALELLDADWVLDALVVAEEEPLVVPLLVAVDEPVFDIVLETDELAEVLPVDDAVDVTVDDADVTSQR